MKKLMPIFCAAIIFTSALHGSTAELPLAAIRELIVKGEVEQAAQAFFNESIPNILNPEQFIASVHALLDPLVENNAIETQASQFSLFFLVELIEQLQNNNSHALARNLSNFIFNGFDNYTEVRALPILYIATELTQSKIMEILLKAGANQNATDPLNGMTALMLAADMENETKLTPIIQLLLEYGANPLLKDKNGKTAREFALAQKHFKTAQLLRDAEVKAALDMPDKSEPS